MKDLFGREHPEPVRQLVHEPRCCTPLSQSIIRLWEEDPEMTDDQTIERLKADRNMIVVKGWGYTEETARWVIADLRRTIADIKTNMQAQQGQP